ncbi:hypothetical protein [Haloactinopolyspora sp.]|uniref:hypothetical protein n=1 Tax=Haloactinopolyspora sp. TaxID=1966353 RepID=UPI00260B2545|nr:hypothetical protein [Haloactinopolyspora sp.]
MASGRRKGISIVEDWVAVSRDHDEAAAHNWDLSTDLRMLSAARWRLELSGHSHWRRGELRDVLASPDAAGELKPLSASAVGRRIKALVDAGQLLPGSWSQCLVLPLFKVQTGMKGTPTECPRKPAGGFPLGDAE